MKRTASLKLYKEPKKLLIKCYGTEKTLLKLSLPYKRMKINECWGVKKEIGKLTTHSNVKTVKMRRE